MLGLSSRKKREIVEEMLLSRYNQYYRLAYSYVHNDADAGDIVQNGAYKAILNCEKLQNEDYAATWVYRIMLNEIFTKYREKEMVSIDEIPGEKGKEDKYEDLDLRRAIESLEKEDRTVVVLRYFEDLKLEEIAQILDENLSTVKSRLYRSMKKLKLQLEPYDESVQKK